MYRSRILLTLVVLAIVGAVALGAGVAVPSTGAQVGQVVHSLVGSASAAAQVAQVTPSPSTLAQAQVVVGAESALLEAVYAKVNPSVVQVINLARSTRFSSTQAMPNGEGSGFVWDTQGHIVTNDHVVRNADKIQVMFADGTTLDATLVGTDPDSDIAVIKVDPALVTLVPVEQGDMTQVKVGQRVAAIGNPFGFAGTMTQGIVSALGRSIPSVTGFSIPEAIQTDAAINPGNSGGPLLNLQGQVIGINDQIQSSSGSSSGIGFAIPINIAQRVVPALIKSGAYQHSYLGIEGGTYTKAWAQALGFPADAKGAYVLGVVADGPAAKAGLRAGTEDTEVLLGTNGFNQLAYLQRGGDLITAINGQSITKMDDLLSYLEEHTSPGDTVRLTVLRDGNQQQTITVTLGQRPSQASNQDRSQLP
ncbi:MAG: trypsin-like peptidase domain-containing protein [Anaerolineae bacterium]|nr:trypsin-like peptidase domain-containing protein [Anaerolineae bacterium]